MTETKIKKLTTAQRVTKLEEETDLIKETITNTINELGQLQQALIKIVSDFDQRMIGLSSAVSAMAGILTGPQWQNQPSAPLEKPADDITTPLNVITTDKEEVLQDGDNT